MGGLKLLLGASLALGCCHHSNFNLSDISKSSKLENITFLDNENNLSARNNIIYECFKKACEIEYEKEENGKDHWQTLDEIEINKKGDCEDMALYLSYLLDNNHIENFLRIGYMYSNDMLDKSKDLHTWVYVELDDEWNVLDPSVRTIIPVSGVGSNYEALGDSHPLREKLLAFKKTYDLSLANLSLD